MRWYCRGNSPQIPGQAGEEVGRVLAEGPGRHLDDSLPCCQHRLHPRDQCLLNLRKPSLPRPLSKSVICFEWFAKEESQASGIVSSSLSLGVYRKISWLSRQFPHILNESTKSLEFVWLSFIKPCSLLRLFVVSGHAASLLWARAVPGGSSGALAVAASLAVVRGL